MKPVILQTKRLVLDQPTLADVDLAVEYCQDPLFEEFMLTPWPYERHHAEEFIGTRVPGWWANDEEFTWAVRHDGEFVGMVGFRAAARDIGYWVGRPHRGRGYMPEAVGAVLDWVFGLDDGDVIWECVPGNAASAAVARKAGFRYTGEGTSLYAHRDRGHLVAWQGAISKSDSRDPKPGWPT
ncbi:MAG TPA: GNAT family N-acetyltransferase [Galbitalea sp.]|nr:GNAT family N-acetyltransferase [Galbitalea sp.]